MNQEGKELLASYLLGMDLKSVVKRKMQEKIIGKENLQKINKSQNLLLKLNEVWSEK